MAKIDEFDFSKSEETIKNIEIPSSAFTGKWIKDKGFSIGIGTIRLTKDYETLEEALNQVGYGVDKDKEGDEILVGVEGVNYDMVVRIVQAILTIEEDKKNG